MHPFLRIETTESIFFDSSYVIIKEFLTPLDIAKYSRIIPDLIRDGHAKLRFRPVTIPSSNVPSSWRSPYLETGSCCVPFSATNVQCITGCSTSLDSESDFPVNIDGFVSFSNGEDTLHRMNLLVKLDDGKSPLEISKAFIYFGSLLKLINKSMEGSEHQRNYAVNQPERVQNLTFKRTLSRLLPYESVFYFKLLGVVNETLRQSNALIYGDRGCGKTHTALTIAAAARLKRGDNVVYLNCRMLRDARTARMETILTELSKTFEDAYAYAPCVVILDDVDLLTPSYDTRGSSDDSAQMHEGNPTEIEQSKLITDLLRHLMRSVKSRVVVLATSQTPASLSQLLLSEGNFGHEIAVPTLDDTDREIMYRNFIRQLYPLEDDIWSGGIDFVRKTRGFSPRDLEQISFRVNNLRLTESVSLSLNQATSEVLDSFVPLSRLGLSSDSTTSRSIKLCDVGGLRLAKADLVSTIVRPSLYRRIYERATVRLPRGVLLFGYPGTGKSMCVPALAHECGFPLIVCRGPELLDKYIGASEAKVRELFARAAASAPSILFFDELDALAPRRGSDHTGVTDRVVNQLLTFLDGVEETVTATNGPVYVIAATSRPDKVDPALLRPGRLEKHIFFGLSNDVGEISEILTTIADCFSLDTFARTKIVSGDLVRKVSAFSPSRFQLFSAADYTAVFRTAQLRAAHKSLTLGRTDDAALISYDNLFEALVAARPSLSEQDYFRLTDIYDTYRNEGVISSSSKLQMQSLRTALK
jgi:SpoVK/Ycf46/Vps4 family AAA+-type ATPase